MKSYLKGALCAIFFLVLSASGARSAVVNGERIMNQGMNENLCALTFDDGPSLYTPGLLDMLASYDIKATFFVLGKNAAYFPGIVKRIAAEGHEIGNHTWSHPNLKRMSSDRQKEEILKTDATLRSMGITPLYMRPPYGSFDERTVRIADELGVSVVLWSLDSYDWKRLPPDYSKLRSTRGTVYDAGALRGVFLFHDIHKGTVDDLPRIIAQLRQGGCERFVTMSDYLAGIGDPEPPLLMTRRPAAPAAVVSQPMYAAGSGATPLARCSKPWRPEEEAGPKALETRAQEEPALDLDEAHAAVSPGLGGI